MIKRVLITGGTGMLGTFLINRFSKAPDFSVYSISRIPQAENIPDVKWFHADILNTEDVKRIIAKIKPDLIIHCAALVNVDQCEKDRTTAIKLHADFTDIILQAAPESRVIYISTDSVFDGIKGNYTETDCTNPLNFYAESKVLGEQKLINSNLNYLILRTNIYGFHSPLSGSLIEWALNSFQKGVQIGGFHDVYFNPLYIGQLSDIILCLSKNDSNGILNIGSDQFISKYDFLVELARIFSFDETLILKKTVDEIHFEAKRPKNTTLNVSRFQQLYGFLPSLKDGMQSLFEEYPYSKYYLL